MRSHIVDNLLSASLLVSFRIDHSGIELRTNELDVRKVSKWPHTTMPLTQLLELEDSSLVPWSRIEDWNLGA